MMSVQLDPPSDVVQSSLLTEMLNWYAVFMKGWLELSVEFPCHADWYVTQIYAVEFGCISNTGVLLEDLWLIFQTCSPPQGRIDVVVTVNVVVFVVTALPE
jgi:hypothetical protein